MSKKINCILEIEEKEFTNKENGDIVKYLNVKTMIDGCNIEFSVKEKYKLLFKHLLSNIK